MHISLVIIRKNRITSYNVCYTKLLRIFALIQHFGKIGSEDVNIYDDWKPSDLPDLPEEKDRVHRAGPIIAMCFIAFGFAILNYYVAAGNIPFVSSLDSDVVVLPVFSIDALSRYLPFWNLSLGLSFAMHRITSYNVCYTKLLRCVDYSGSGMSVGVG